MVTIRQPKAVYVLFAMARVIMYTSSIWVQLQQVRRYGAMNVMQMYYTATPTAAVKPVKGLVLTYTDIGRHI